MQGAGRGEAAAARGPGSTGPGVRADPAACRAPVRGPRSFGRGKVLGSDFLLRLAHAAAHLALEVVRVLAELDGGVHVGRRVRVRVREERDDREDDLLDPEDRPPALLGGLELIARVVARRVQDEGEGIMREREAAMI